MNTLEPSSSRRGWENEPPHRPFSLLLDEKWIVSNEAWQRFHIIPSMTQPLRHNAPSIVSPCVPLRFVKRREWKESRTMNSSLSEGTCDQSTSLESFSVCVVPPLKMPTSQTSGAIMCENPRPMWRYWLRICRHRIPINWHGVGKTVTVYAISVCSGERKCHWIPPRTGSWRLVIRWKGSCHGDIWVL